MQTRTGHIYRPQTMAPAHRWAHSANTTVDIQVAEDLLWKSPHIGPKDNDNLRSTKPPLIPETSHMHAPSTEHTMEEPIAPAMQISEFPHTHGPLKEKTEPSPVMTGMEEAPSYAVVAAPQSAGSLTAVSKPEPNNLKEAIEAQIGEAQHRSYQECHEITPLYDDPA